MSNVSSCSVASLPQGRTAPIQALALLRIPSILGWTAWTAGTVGLVADPRLALHRWARGILDCLGVELEIRGRLNHWPQLWVSNHLSWLDPLILLSLRPMAALAKGEVAQYPLIGRAAQKAGLAFVDREDAMSRAAAIVRLVKELNQGNPLLLFPEGTTTVGNRLAPLQEGGLRAAYRCKAAVQTLRLSSQDVGYPWIGDDTLLPHLMKIARTPTTLVRLEAGAVLGPQQFQCEDEWIEAIRLQLLPTP